MYIHIDLDCFFVSCERIKYPQLQKAPVVVVNCGDTKIFSKKKISQSVITQNNNSHFVPNMIYNKMQTSINATANFSHTAIQRGCRCGFCHNARKSFYDQKIEAFKGIVVAKSYEAKAYGIKTGTKLQEALHLCPQLTVLTQDYLFYYEQSLALKRYLHSQIPHLQQYSIDEFFGDLSGWVSADEVKNFIQSLQQKITHKLNLPVSIGASSGKWIAKLATSHAKPYGTKVVQKDKIQDFIHNIKVEEFPGIGKAYKKKLHDRGVTTLGQCARVKGLFDSWGKHGKQLYAHIHAQNKEYVKRSDSRQSIGISRVFETVYEPKQIIEKTSILSSHLAYTIIDRGLNPTNFFFKIKNANQPSAKLSIQCNRAFSENFYKQLCKENIAKLIPKNPQVFSIALAVSSFTQNRAKTLCLLEYEQDLKKQKLERSFLSIRQKYGLGAIGYGA